MSSKNRQFRRKVVPDDNLEENAGPAPPSAPLVAKQKVPDRKKEKTKVALLSFDDDEGPVALVEKGKKEGFGAGRLQPSGFKNNVREAKPSHTQVSAAGEYSADKLRELKSNTKSLPASKQPKPAAEPTFKLQGSFKLAGAAKDDRFDIPAHRVVVKEGRAQPSGGGPEESGEMLPPPPGRPPKAEAEAEAARPPAGAPGDSDDEDDHFAVPDADTIRKAKEKRERLRTAHLAPDYIPLGGAAALLKKDGGAEAKTGKREESDSEEEAEEQLRMSFLGAARDTGKSKSAPSAAKAESAQAADMGEDEDDEWVREQIRRGARVAAPPPPQPRVGAARGGPAAGPGVLAPTAPEEIAAAGHNVIAALQQGLARLHATHSQAEKQLGKVSGNLRESIASISRLEADLGRAGDKYTYLQELRAYIGDLCDMLQVKSPIVEELEEAMLAVREGRSSTAAECGAADEEEEYGPAAAAVAAALGVLSRGGATAAATAAAENAATEAEEKLLSGSARVELDEFGRDVNVARRKETQERAARRKKRLEEQHLRRKTDKETVEEWWGVDTTDESEGEIAHYRLRRNEILETAQAAFADAGDDFGALPAVKARLEAWKAAYLGAYRDAYMSLSTPAVFAPFVRLELLGWDPIFEASGGFDQQAWYRELFDFGMAEANGEAEPADADEELVPRLVRELVLPVARHAVRSCWNPFSCRQTKAVLNLIKDLLVYVPADDDRLQGLLEDVQNRLQDAVASIQVPAWSSEATAVSARALAIQGRRFGKTLRFLRNVAAFEGTLARGPLITLALDRVVDAKLLPFLRKAAGKPSQVLERCKRVADALPAAWFAGPRLRGAEGLLQLLADVGRGLQAGQGGKEARSHGRRLVKLLAKLGDAERANRLTSALKL